MNVQETRIDVIGNNLSNANTVGFKSSRVVLGTQFSQLFSVGTSPTATDGGSNPMQTGMGAIVAASTLDFGQGTLQTTGGASDLAIQGNGMFHVEDFNGQALYTRNGTFQVNSNSTLVSSQGHRVQGYQVDSNYNILPGTVGDLTIPLGNLRVAEATTSATVAGNLNSSGAVGSQGSILTCQALTDGNGGPPIIGATVLTNVFDGATQLFNVGDVVTLGGHKGNRQLGDETLTVGAASTVTDFLSFMQGAMGINTTAGVPGAPGVTVNAGGEIVVNGNYGTENELEIRSGDLSSSGSPTSPLTFASSQSADGESIYTSFIAYDSLGNEVRVGLTAVFETAATSGNTFRIYADSSDDSDADICVGTATLTFDQEGQLTSSTGNTLTIDRAGTGALTPMAIAMDVGTVTGLASSISQLGVTDQNGSPEGTLTRFNVDRQGRIYGTFDNGLTRVLGQVVLARFANPAGLVAVAETLYRTGPNSGSAVLAAPNTMGVGQITAGAVELSNTDVSQNFVDLILASAGFTANTRLITTANEMLAEILAAAR